MLKQRLLIGIVTSIFLLVAPTFAHPLSGDGPISGELKFDPDDAPASGKPLLAHLAFVSVNGVNVNLLECFCRMLVYQGQVSAQAKPEAQVTFANSGKRLEGRVTFPKPGAYIVVIMGRPLPGKQLAPFILTTLIVVN